MAMKKRTYYLICMGVILVIALIMSVKGGLFSAGERAEIFRILSDSFFVPGVLFVGAGALSWGALYGGSRRSGSSLVLLSTGRPRP